MFLSVGCRLFRPFRLLRGLKEFRSLRNIRGDVLQAAVQSAAEPVQHGRAARAGCVANAE